VGGGRGPEQVRTADPATTTSAPAPTTTTTSPPAPEPVPADDALWPPSGRGFTAPLGAARSFVEEYVGFPDPPLSAFRDDGESAGEVDVLRVGEGGAVLPGRVAATVALRLDGTGWVVTGARSPDIEVDGPRPLDTVGGMFVAEGRSRGYEGTVVVSVIERGATAAGPLALVAGIGGAYEMEPFHLDVVLPARPSAPLGAVLFTTDTGCDGCNTAFAAVPVRLGTATAGGGA
ncbi:MAG: hypothetical protein ACRD03_01200, partial [Acidimicrobiales bacterium]